MPLANTTINLVAPAAGADPNRYVLTVIGTGETFAGTDTTINTTDRTITRKGLSYPFQTGQPVVYHFSAGAGVPGLTNNTVYHVIRVNDRVFKLATDLANAAAGTAVPLTGALAAGDSFTLTAKGSASTFDEKQIDAVNGTIHVQHRFVTGQEVVYQRFSNPPVGLGDAGTGLTDGTTYFAIRVSDDTIKLATNLDNAKSGTAIPLTAPGTPNLGTGDAPNRYTLVALDPSPAFVTGTTFATGPYRFDLSAMNGNTLSLPSHEFATGDALLYRAPEVTGAAARVPIQGLTDNTIYYAIRLGNGAIQLATNADDAIAGKAIKLTYPTQTSTGAHSLTNMGPGTQFTGNLVDDAQRTIRLDEHPFQTGQAVLYRAGKDETIRELLPDGSNRLLASNTTFYVIRVDANTIRLAKDAADSFAGKAIKLVKPGDATRHALTALMGFSNFGKLEGGREHDTTSLLPNDAPRGPLADATSRKVGHTFTDVNPDKTDLTDATLRGVGGRINELAGVPGNNQDFYAASEYGGLWRSDNQGRNWEAVLSHLPQVTWDVEVSPQINPGGHQPVYVTSWFDGRPDTGAGIQVSYDEGESWIRPVTGRPNPVLNGAVIDNTPDPRYFIDGADQYRLDEFKAFGIAVRPDNPNYVVIGTSAGLAISDDAGRTWQFIDPTPTTPVTDVWGVNYQRARVDLPNGVDFPLGIIDIVGDDGHLRSFDGGLTWGYGTGLKAAGGAGPRNFTAGPLGTFPDAAKGLASIAVSPDESYVIFVVASDERTVAGRAAGRQGDDKLYESDDGGATWSAPLGNPDIQGRVPFVVANDRTLGFDLWFGDVRLYRASGISGNMPGPLAGAIPTRIAPATNGERWSFSTTGASSDSGALAFDLSNPAADNKTPLIYGNDSGIFFNRAGGLIDHPSSITIPGHGLNTGDTVRFRKTGGADHPQLRHNTDYFVIKVDNDTIRLAFNAVLAAGNRPIPLTRPTGGAVGTYTLTPGAGAALAFNQGAIPQTLWEESTVSPHAMWLFGMAGVNQPGGVVDLTIVMQDTGVAATTNAQAASNAARAWHMVPFGDGFDAAAAAGYVLFTRQ